MPGCGGDVPVGRKFCRPSCRARFELNSASENHRYRSTSSEIELPTDGGHLKVATE